MLYLDIGRLHFNGLASAGRPAIAKHGRLSDTIAAQAIGPVEVSGIVASRQSPVGWN